MLVNGDQKSIKLFLWNFRRCNMIIIFREHQLSCDFESRKWIWKFLALLKFNKLLRTRRFPSGYNLIFRGRQHPHPSRMTSWRRLSHSRTHLSVSWIEKKTCFLMIHTRWWRRTQMNVYILPFTYACGVPCLDFQPLTNLMQTHKVKSHQSIADKVSLRR